MKKLFTDALVVTLAILLTGLITFSMEPAKQVAHAESTKQEETPSPTPEPTSTPTPVVETPAPTPEPTPVATVAPVPKKATPAPAPVATGSEAEAKMWIYMHESGNVPCKINGGAVDCSYNGNRACGIGQALPCQKLTAVCSLSNYACQDAWFTSYMKARYGSWNNAKAFWLKNLWW